MTEEHDSDVQLTDEDIETLISFLRGSNEPVDTEDLVMVLRKKSG